MCLLLILYGYLFAYSLFVGIIGYGWYKAQLRLQLHIPLPTNTPQTPLFSVLLPVRNEAHNLPQLLQRLAEQTLPLAYFEVIVIDDASTDTSTQVVRTFQTTHKFCSLLQLHTTGQTGKKNALTYGITHAKGQWIVTTDGDSLPPTTWLAAFYQFILQNPALQCITAPVRMEATPNNLLAIFQAIDFASLIGTGAACVLFGKPTMCNGANLAYRKTAFETVRGYEGNIHIASGDDEFLLRKIHRHFGTAIGFLGVAESIVSTPPQSSWRALVAQRRRWASKWNLHGWQTKVIALAVFSFHLLAVGLAILACIMPHWRGHILLFWGVKWIAEQLFLGNVLRFLGQRKYVRWIGLVGLLYPLFVVVIGTLSNHKNYQWKGRTYKHNIPHH